MADLTTLLDCLSRAFALVFIAVGLLTFFFRKFVGAAIDASFKRRLDADTERLKSQLGMALEEKKAELNQRFGSELEAVKNKFALDLEQEKQKLAESTRRGARVYDLNAMFYESFRIEYGNCLVNLYAIKTLRDLVPNGDAISLVVSTSIKSNISDLINSISDAQKALGKFDPYVDVVNIGVRVATLYNDLIKFLAGGAENYEVLDKLNNEYGIICSVLRRHLTDGLKISLLHVPELGLFPSSVDI